MTSIELKIVSWLFWKIVWHHSKWPVKWDYLFSKTYCCPIDYICTKLDSRMEALEAKIGKVKQ